MEPIKTLNETVDMMLSDAYKERFKAEYYQVEYRINKLATMIYDWTEGTLNFEPKCPISVLYSQLFSMETYRHLLRVRAEIEHIDL